MIADKYTPNSQEELHFLFICSLSYESYHVSEIQMAERMDMELTSQPQACQHPYIYIWNSHRKQTGN